jgi:UDP-N-acetylmuramate dehydrogenase
MISDSVVRRALTEFLGCLHAAEPMSGHTSFRIGGPARLFAAPTDVETLCRLLAFCSAETIPWFVLGAGTNLLVSDRGYDGLVIHLRKGWGAVRIAENAVEVGAGHPLPGLARKMAQAGLSGLEFAAGIPGSVGGAVAMNAGAFSGGMSQVVTHAECLTAGGKPVVLESVELRFSYRDSHILHERLVVTRVHFTLTPREPAEILCRMEEFWAQRKARQPLSAWSAGSVFRNPPGDAAGRLIEAAGCKGMRVGGALVSLKHANFIVNTGTASAADVVALIRTVQHRVHERFGVRLEPEITFLGHFDE